MLSLTSPLILFGLGMTGLTFWIFLFYPCKTSVKGSAFDSVHSDRDLSFSNHFKITNLRKEQGFSL